MFPKQRTYLDAAAAAPITARARAAFVRASRAYGNPSSPHEEGRAARACLEDARTRIARLTGVKSEAVIFTASATEANTLALVGSSEARLQAGSLPSDLHVLYLPSAHSSTLGAMKELARLGVITETLKLKEGKIDLAHLRTQLRPETVLVAVESICGETGTRFAVRDVRRALDETGRHIHLHVDAAQAPRTDSIERTHLGADTLSLDAQKIGGVRGIGALIAPRHISIAPRMYGGGQERGMRPGTEASALASAFATALEDAQKGRQAFSRRATRMRASLLAILTHEFPDLLVTEGADHAPHVLNLSFVGIDTDYLVALLDEAGLAVATRSACETDALGSRAVFELTGDRERANATLRVSWAPDTRARDLSRFARSLTQAVRFLRESTV